MLAWVCLWWGARPATSTRSIPRQADSSHCRLESAPVPNSWPADRRCHQRHHLRGKPRWQFGTSAVLEEVDTASLDVLATGLIGLGASGGTKLKIYQPAFSNDYYNDPSTGIVSVCGTGAADTTPWQYVFGFSGRTMNTPFSFSQQLLTSTAAQCSGWTEFFNPMSAAARERISFSSA